MPTLASYWWVFRILPKAAYSKNAKGYRARLTPLKCCRLMGFDKECQKVS
jgi:hypothetical protein